MKKTAESELKQLKTALLDLADLWESTARVASRRTVPDREESTRNITLYGSFTQASTALHLLVEKIENLPGDARPEEVRDAARRSSIESGDVWQ